MKKIKVTMTETKYGADDGFTVVLYETGKTYELGEDLAGAFLAEKWAVPFKAPKPAAAPVPPKPAAAAPVSPKA